VDRRGPAARRCLTPVDGDGARISAVGGRGDHRPAPGDHDSGVQLPR
jgi:hypothetical protein